MEICDLLFMALAMVCKPKFLGILSIFWIW